MAEISAVTGIAVDYLKHESGARASVATKMSWISKRKTSRVEDIAYCLLGIFDVNMPLFYGEGRKAFFRLELEILRNSDDETIFAWRSDHHKFSGLLAQSPEDFADSADIVRSLGLMFRPPYSMTNKGLKVCVPKSSLPLFPLECWQASDDGKFKITLTLQKLGGTWQRINCQKLYNSEYDNEINTTHDWQEIHIRQDWFWPQFDYIAR